MQSAQIKIRVNGRLKLYEEIERLGDRIVYFDTDSCIYISNEGREQEDPTLGNFLGQHTNKLPEGQHIVEFVSGGAKNYAYKTNTGDTKCTVKGISFNRIVSLKVHFETMKHIVTEEPNAKISVPQLKFTRDNKLWTVRADEGEKNYGVVYDKRVLVANFNTLPYGY